jgi:diacylglycerol kinase (ATP)
MRKILLFVNPALLQTRTRRRDIARVRSVFHESGAAIDVLETGEHRAAGAKSKQAVTQGYDAIVVCGGDGTLFDVIQGMAGSVVPLGIIPFGTGNVMAQNLKVPLDPASAARAVLRSHPLRVPLGRITCCTADGPQTWFFAMAAGMGLHAALMSEARRAGKDITGRAAYFLAGGRLLLNYPVQPFDVAVTTAAGSVIQQQVCEAIALRVEELNRWRPGGGLELPFLRLATVEGGSRSRLAQATYEALFRPGGEAAAYRDVLRVVCTPISGRKYEPPIAVQADGEVLGASSATIEMAGQDVVLLSAASISNRN